MLAGLGLRWLFSRVPRLINQPAGRLNANLLAGGDRKRPQGSISSAPVDSERLAQVAGTALLRRPPS